MGKRIEQISQTTMNAFIEYSWPGNIRELQNVVERSVIVSSDGVFCVDAAWLSRDSRRVSLPQQPEPTDADEDASRERQIIENALAGSRGRVSGPNGAAARLRVPPSTLEHRIKKLALQDLVWVKPRVGLATRAARPDSPPLPERFFCQFGQLASEGSGERSTMLEGRRLFTHTEAGRTRPIKGGIRPDLPPNRVYHAARHSVTTQCIMGRPGVRLLERRAI